MKNTPDHTKNGGLTPVPHVLYKYMSLERFMLSFDDYLAGKMWFANRKSLNDPMESVPLPKRFVSEGGGAVEPEILKSLKAFKVCSLLPECENFAMWSHYAKKHTGVCVGFEINPDNPFPAITRIDTALNEKAERDRIMLAQVKYDKSIPVVESDGNIIWRDIQNLFCRKLKSWEYENEWRLVVSSGKAQMLAVGTVVSIFLGYKCKLHADKIFNWLTPEQQANISVGPITLVEGIGEGLRLAAPGSIRITEMTAVSKSGPASLVTTNFRDKNEWDKAIAEYTRMLEFKPDYLEALVNRGLAYISKGDWNRAIVDCDAALEFKPDYLEALVNRGLAYIGKGEYDKAIANFNKALDIMPDDFCALIFRGFVYIIGKSEDDKAIADFNKALDIHPNDFGAFTFRGLAYYRKGEYDKAIADFNKALDIMPDNAELHENIAMARTAQAAQAAERRE